MKPDQLPLPPAAGFVATVINHAPVYHVLAVPELARLARARDRVRQDFAHALTMTDAGSGPVRIPLRQPGSRLSNAAWLRLARSGFAKYGETGRPKLIARDESAAKGWLTNRALGLPSAAWIVLAAMRAELSYHGIAQCTGWLRGYVRHVADALIVHGWIRDDMRPTPRNRESCGRTFTLSPYGAIAQRSRGARAAGLQRGAQQAAERAGRAREARRMRDTGATTADIARALKVSERSIWRYLTDSSQPEHTDSSQPRQTDSSQPCHGQQPTAPPIPLP